MAWQEPVSQPCLLLQEKVLSERTSRWEMLAMLGLFGSAVSGLQALLLERDEWWWAGAGRQAAWGPAQATAMAGFVLSLYLFYILVPR